MTMLPTWIDRSYGLDYEKNKLKEALAIALEIMTVCGMGTIGKVMTHEEIGRELGDVMRRIAELGKETV